MYKYGDIAEPVEINVLELNVYEVRQVRHLC